MDTGDSCAYSHVRVNPKAKVCEDFLKGFCPLGTSCKLKHTYPSKSKRKPGVDAGNGDNMASSNDDSGGGDGTGDGTGDVIEDVIEEKKDDGHEANDKESSHIRIRPRLEMPSWMRP